MTPPAAEAQRAHGKQLEAARDVWQEQAAAGKERVKLQAHLTADVDGARLKLGVLMDQVLGLVAMCLAGVLRTLPCATNTYHGVLSKQCSTPLCHAWPAAVVPAAARPSLY